MNSLHYEKLFFKNYSIIILLKLQIISKFRQFYRSTYQITMVKAYNGALLLADVLLLILKILYYICESVYKFFVPTEEKSVVGEIVLVCIKFTKIYVI